MARYALANHVFICLNGEQLVLLDLKADRYWQLEAAQTAGLASLVEGWPVKWGEQSEAEATAALEVLRGRGIVVAPGTIGKGGDPVAATPPARELMSDDAPTGEPLGSLLTFVGASLRAKLLLRVRSFQYVIERVHRRKLQGLQRTPVDLQRARQLVAAFARYRVFLFSSKDECLYDSLALLEFLAHYGIYADWVYGVQTRPFAAHCWVQHADVVFNDTVEHVSGYTPIMVV